MPRLPLAILRRLPRPTARGGGVILFDNRYLLNEEDAPGVEQLRAMAIERVLAHPRAGAEATAPVIPVEEKHPDLEKRPDLQPDIQAGTSVVDIGVTD